MQAWRIWYAGQVYSFTPRIGSPTLLPDTDHGRYCEWEVRWIILDFNIDPGAYALNLAFNCILDIYKGTF
jgi:hypothetical protein